ncbi:mRNA cleavage and polyadenylation factor subunit [Agyrium rufum]|nr:mRNA cleavage and polyadenylation factor subunit [Agyrium rufum]
MQCYADLTLPTAVTASLSLPFLSSSTNNLVVAKTSILQIFSFKSVITEVREGDGDDSTLPRPTPQRQRPERIHTTKPVLIGQYEVSGTITALGRVKIKESLSGGEALLIALKDAKLSLVQWDPEKFTLSTISIHLYEGDDLRGAPWSPELSHVRSQLAVDPQSRCAALKFGARNLAIVPFSQDDDTFMNDEDDMNGDELSKTEKLTNGDTPKQSVFRPSFVLSLVMLDPTLLHPIHLAFLHEYRDPTFGILSSVMAPSSALLEQRRDIVSYTIYTMDLEQKASTALLSVSDLPYDLHTVMPLAAPIEGALLIGFNELIHVDQSGRSNGLAVNEFAKICSSFTLAQQPDLQLRLEGCIIESLNTGSGDMLVILPSGEVWILQFKKDGRSISGLTLAPVSSESIIGASMTGLCCASSIGRGRLFLGGACNDSLVVGWNKRAGKAKDQSAGDLGGEGEADEFDELDDADDDDLYGEIKPEAASNAVVEDISSHQDGYSFRVHDRLLNLATLDDMKIMDTEGDSANATPLNDVRIVLSKGTGTEASVCEMTRKIRPTMGEGFELPDVDQVWSFAMSSSDATSALAGGAHNILLASSSRSETTQAHRIVDGKLVNVSEGDFEPEAGPTVAATTILEGTRIVQVLGKEVRSYENDLGLAQIFPLFEDADDVDATVVEASFSEPYILLVLSDQSVRLLKAEDTGDLEEIEGMDYFKGHHWISGSLYDDANDLFRLEPEEENDDEGGNVLMFLIEEGSGLKIFHLSNLSNPVYVADGIVFFPPFLSPEFTGRRGVPKEEIEEIVVAELGDTVSKSPYLILRAASDEIVLYHPYQASTRGNSKKALRFLKTPSSHFPEIAPSEDDDEDVQGPKKLVSMPDVGGYSCIAITGKAPTLIIKTSSALPYFIPLATDDLPVSAMCSYHSRLVPKGFLQVSQSGSVKSAKLPAHNDYSTGWEIKKIFAEGDVERFSFHKPTNRYILGCTETVPFQLPDDDQHPGWGAGGKQASPFNGFPLTLPQDMTLLPLLPQSVLKLLDPVTRHVTDTYSMLPYEIITSIEVLDLETSEITSHRKPLIAVGTAIVRGEDLPSIGQIYVFDIIPVVPEPDQPETSYRFKLIAKEEIKGAVTSLTHIGTEGFLVAAQGQKLMVRGLKEDGTLLPVSFMDLQCFVSEVKELPGTGLGLVGDAAKGAWLVAYTVSDQAEGRLLISDFKFLQEDPYTLRLLSKSPPRLQVSTLSFLPCGSELYAVVADSANKLYVFQYDPEHPKSLSGSRLLQQSTFSISTSPHSSYLLRLPPSSSSSESLETVEDDVNTAATQPHAVLFASPTGCLSIIQPLPQQTYLSLLSLQTTFQNPSAGSTNHYLGLNPKEFRRAEGDFSVGGRVILDGNLLRRGVVGVRGSQGVDARRLVGEVMNGRVDWD